MARPTVAGFARATFFALTPALATAGAMGMPVLLSLVGALGARRAMLRQLIENRPLPLLLLLGFGTWAMLTALWSPYPDPQQAAKLFFLLPLGLAFAAAASADTNLTRPAALAAFVVLAALLTIEAAGNMPLNRSSQAGDPDWKIEQNLARAAVVFIAMSWGVAGIALTSAGRWRFALGAGVLALGAVFSLQFHQSANVVAYGLGLGAFVLALAAPRIAPWLVCGGWAFWMLAAPLLTPMLTADPALVENAPYGWAVRVSMWDYVCARIAEAPLFGHGLDASRAVTDTMVVRGDAMPAVLLHPHSASLHIWFETGLVGAALASATLIAGARWLARAFAEHRIAAAAACGAIASLGFIANVSYGVWQEWWTVAMLLAAGLIGAIVVPRERH
ncbi:MAG: O-antigen ligase family protein [Hyphomonadaceae bacterium]